MAEPRDAGELTHFDRTGAAHMVDVAAKPETPRMARARARVRMATPTLAKIEAGRLGKGDVLGVARLGGIAAAKQTAIQIPLCHPVRITAIAIEFELDAALPGVIVEASVEVVDRTGPEMEAMMAASGAALTIYDMCKAIDRGMEIVEVSLIEKRGGKSGHWTRDEP